MTEPEIPPQSHYLYNGLWNARLDSYMLELILMCKRRDQWTGFNVPSYVLEETARQLNNMYGLDLSVSQICARIKFMHNRYHAFKSVVPPAAATQWDLSTNTITAHYKVWRKLFKKDKLTLAYYWNGDPEYKNLMALFGMDEEIKQEGGKAVIVISDTSSPKEHRQTGKECDDEVNSPSEGIMRARRRLFPNADHVSDAGSTTIPPEATFPGSMSFPYRYVPDIQGSVPGDEGSQCASSHPYSPITGYFKKH